MGAGDQSLDVARSPEGECGSVALFPGSKIRGMENSYSSAFYFEIPDVNIYENQPVGRGVVPAATQDQGTLERSRTMETLFTKRCGVEWGLPRGVPA